MIELSHIVFTRFAIQNLFGGSVDVFDEEYFASRCTLLKIFSLPALKAQSTQDFTWIVVVDQNLPEKWIAHLTDLISQRPRSFVLKYPGAEFASKTDWISDYILSDTDYLITSYLDDDDSLPNGYIEAMHRDLRKSHQNRRLNPVKIMAPGKTVQWDMIFSKQASFGYRCAWHRQHVQTTSCGFSVCCKYPELQRTVFGMRHRAAFNYLSFNEEPMVADVAEFRRSLLERCRSAGLMFNGSDKDNFSDICEQAGPVLAANHHSNSQVERLREQKNDYTKVEGPETFHEFSIDWDELIRNRDQFADD